MESNGEIESSAGKSYDVKDRRVGLIFDERMCKHYAPNGEDHPECPDRIRVIWERLNSSGLAKRCIILNAKDAEDNHIALVHTKNHIDLIKSISSKNSESKRKRIASKFNSIYFNEGSTEAAYLAAGSVIEAAEKVAKGELDSAFAIVRPPGHHAEEGEPMGFCLYNNVGIATSYLLNERRELGIKKILIVDWDVHHGNGTQKMFYGDPRVLFFSVHRYDFGTFYPAGHDGSHIMTGEDAGAGHNINVPWEHGRCGDADYLAVWDHILIPVAKEFDPNMILISAGFDAAIGDPLGGCRISPYGYSIMLDKLMDFAGGKIVMALEGGYNLNSIASSARACVEVLLDEKPPNVVSETYPFASTWRVIQEVRRELSTYWPVLAVELPEKIISKTSLMEILSSDSEVETEDITLNVSEEVQTFEDVIQPFAILKVDSVSQVLFSGEAKKKTKKLRPVLEVPKSLASSERTQEAIRSPSPLSNLRRQKRRLEATVVASDDEKCHILGTQEARPRFPEDVEFTIAKFVTASTKVVDMLNESVVQFEQLSRASQKWEEEKVVLKKEVSAAKARARDAEKREAAVKQRVAQMEAEVEVLRRREAELVASQGDVLRAFVERIFLSASFSGLANDLAAVVNSTAVAFTLDRVAAEYPDLDKAKYGYEVVSREAILREYAETLVDGMKNLPVVESLASSRTILTAEAIRGCEVDRDPVIEEAIANLDKENRRGH